MNVGTNQPKTKPSLTEEQIKEEEAEKEKKSRQTNKR